MIQYKKTARLGTVLYKSLLIVAKVYAVPFPLEVVVSAGVSIIPARTGVDSTTGAGLGAGFLATGFFFCGGAAFFAAGFLGAAFFTAFFTAFFGAALGRGRFAAFFTAFLATFFGAAFLAAFFFTVTFLAAFFDDALERGRFAAFFTAFFLGAGLGFAFFLEGILQDFGVNDELEVN